MGFLSRLVGGGPLVPQPLTAEAPSFAVDAESIDPAVFGLTSYASPVAPAPRISRREAIQVPAVKRSRDLIAGTLGTLPLKLYNPSLDVVNTQLFDQPEKDRPRTVTMTKTAEDLLFEGVAWWLVTEFAWHGYPVRIKVLDPRDVTVNEDTGQVYVNGKPVSDDRLIRFDSPNDPLLIAGARAIRTALMLDTATQRYSEGSPPLDYFTPAEGADPADDDDIVAMLDGWKSARQMRSTGYVPAALKYNIAGFNPEQLQLADARQHAALEIGRVTGVDPEALGISTTSRTYFNAEHKRKEFIDFTLGGYLAAIEGRLSMGDVTPRGYYAKFVLDAFLRSDTKTRMETYEIGKRVGAYTDDEIRELEDRAPLTPSQKPAPLRALPSAQEEEAVNG